jgi:signal transduction histidine kinase
VWTESSASVVRTLTGEVKYVVGECVDVTQRKLADEALANVNRKLIEGQEQERSRIGRELHDDIIQRMMVLRIQLQKMKAMPRERAEEFLVRIESVIKELDDISAAVQALSHRLHSSKLEYLGMTAAMAGFCSEFAAHRSVEIQFSYEGIRSDTPAEISLCLFRVLQEALQNAVKHSGVRSFDVHLSGTPNEIVLKVSDAGVGFDPEAARSGWGLGLLSMRERLRLVNGQVSVSSKANEGTTIVARVPLISRSTRQSNGL